MCVKCSFGFYFGAKGLCKLIPPTCSSFDTVKELCTACYSGYELNKTNQCVQSSLELSDPGCNEFKNGVCIKCSFGYYFGSTGKCRLSPPTCINFDTVKEVCRGCYPGYTLNKDNICILSEAGQSDAGCNEFKDGSCIKCSFGFYFGPLGNCKLIPPTCTNFNTTLEVCRACYPGYALNNNKNCVISAPEAGDSGCN